MISLRVRPSWIAVVALAVVALYAKKLIDEQTAGKSSTDLSGGVVSPYSPGRRGNARDVGEVQGRGGRLVGSKYAVNIESILNRPFEGLALKSQ